MGLVLGFGLGLWAYQSKSTQLYAIIPIASLAGKLWLCALITLAIPLVSAYLFSIISSISNGKFAGKIGLHALGFHVLIMTLGIVFTLFTSYAFINVITQGVTLNTDSLLPEVSGHKTEWMILRNADAYQIFVAKLILPTLVLSVIFSWITSRFFSGLHEKALAGATATAQRVTHWMTYVLLLMPVAAFGLTFVMVSEVGYALAGLMGRYVLAIIIMLIVLVFFLYLLATGLAGITLKQFANALLPAQLVAATSRSSLATMPVLLERAEQTAQFPATVTRLVIPLSVSVFRLNRSVSSIFSYVFLTEVYQIPTTVPATIVFLLLIMILSFGSPGVPSGGKLATMPVFLSLGVPLEMIILTKAIDALPDIFKTVLNVTEAFTITALVTRSTAKTVYNTSG